MSLIKCTAPARWAAEQNGVSMPLCSCCLAVSLCSKMKHLLFHTVKEHQPLPAVSSYKTSPYKAYSPWRWAPSQWVGSSCCASLVRADTCGHVWSRHYEPGAFIHPSFSGLLIWNMSMTYFLRVLGLIPRLHFHTFICRGWGEDQSDWPHSMRLNSNSRSQFWVLRSVCFCKMTLKNI